MRTCKKCGATKDDGEFEIRLTSGQPRKWCRTCQRAAARVTYAANRQQRKLNAKGEDYGSRNANLRRMGFGSYAEYLASDLWREIRRKVFAAKGRACSLCNAPASQLHHNRYHTNDLKGKRLTFISPVCRSCHERIEFQGGRKVGVMDAARAFRKQRRRQKT